jgi:hypothetical protein
MRADDELIEHIAAEIASYLARHPDAADSSEGIHRWWLTEAAAQARPQQVQEACDRLVQRALLYEDKLPDGRTVYRGSRDRR